MPPHPALSEKTCIHLYSSTLPDAFSLTATFRHFQSWLSAPSGIAGVSQIRESPANGLPCSRVHFGFVLNRREEKGPSLDKKTNQNFNFPAYPVIST
jgi:hypothetical protein